MTNANIEFILGRKFYRIADDINHALRKIHDSEKFHDDELFDESNLMIKGLFDEFVAINVGKGIVKHILSRVLKVSLAMEYKDIENENADPVELHYEWLAKYYRENIEGRNIEHPLFDSILDFPYLTCYKFEIDKDAKEANLYFVVTDIPLDA